jgi:putative acetyltransferase
MYEVRELATLASAAYLDRLNNPSPWTSKMMQHYRGMTRGLCTVAGAYGSGLGQAGLLLRFKPAPGTESSTRDWLLQDALPRLPSKAGLCTACLFEGALAPQMTNEQRIRGADAGIDWAVWVTGYSQESVANLAQSDLGMARIEQRGATGVTGARYQMQYMLAGQDAGAMEIRRDDLTGPQVRALLEEHLRSMHSLSPPESVHALDLEGLRQPEITFWTVWSAAGLLGCGALKQIDARHGEIKSMRTVTAHRRNGVGRAMVAHILAEARRRNYTRLSLETGAQDGFEAARRLYESFSFSRCGPFEGYVEDPNSVFMTRDLHA